MLSAPDRFRRPVEMREPEHRTGMCVGSAAIDEGVNPIAHSGATGRLLLVQERETSPRTRRRRASDHASECLQRGTNHEARMLGQKDEIRWKEYRKVDTKTVKFGMNCSLGSLPTQSVSSP